MNRSRIAVLVLAAAAAATHVAGLASGARQVSARAEARGVATDFFRSINERRYEQTCALLSTTYYRRNRIPSHRHCVIALRIGFMWSQEIRYRITGVTAARNRAVAEALADGRPGRMVLVREPGGFKVLALEST